MTYRQQTSSVSWAAARGESLSESASRKVVLYDGILKRGLALAVMALGLISARAVLPPLNDSNPMEMPAVGSHGLRIISPTILELTLITTKAADPAGVAEWDFVTSDGSFQPKLPAAAEFSVVAGTQPLAVRSVGFKRRVLYAPLTKRDLRIGNYLYVELAAPLAEGQAVEVKNPSGLLWSADREFKCAADPLRWSPAIHVNQVGYHPDQPKKGMIGYFLGSFGEMKSPSGVFKLVDEAGAVVFSGTLTARLDEGYVYSPRPYQQVLEADFSVFKTPGQYRLQVPGLGVSFPFRIDEGTPAAFARAFALGMYHQRCGMKNEFPYSRFLHDACHVAAADVPTMAFQKTQEFIASVSSDFANNPRHTAPQLKDVSSSLYPFARQGKIDVSGGHHDAGDYSKYTINSSGLIHFLVFAADSFPGAGDLDNLGIPESGDGKSDLLQEAKWEADYLAKMQDTDGGFYFLTYPREREYEQDVLPDHGDPQVVWPKNTAVTAAAVAALAEAGSSPRFKQQFPAEAALYMEKAVLGWTFLMNAIARFGKDGAYQKLTHYGNEFMHDDELAWAAAALYAATGDPAYHAKLMEWFPEPNDPATRRWSWWRLFEGYGCAVRTYAFAARSGRLSASQLDASYLAKCEAEILAAADDQVHFARESAYGTSFPDLNKSYRSAGWYFSSERAFDATVAWQISPKAEYRETVVGNVNFEAGCNPVNMSYITGIGAKRQRDIVHQYAQNDRRTLPPSGLPLGNVQTGFEWHEMYKGELKALSFPGDEVPTAPYPYYDRWGDAFNTSTEFVVMDQARSLASHAFWMAQTTLKTQPWKGALGAQITGLPAQVPAEQTITATLEAPGLDLSKAQVVWEARDQQPRAAAAFNFAAPYSGDQWVEVEAMLPDGRRVFAATNFVAITSATVPPNTFQSAPQVVASDTVALFHLDGSTADANGRTASLTLSGKAVLDQSNLGWLANRTGAALKISDLGDKAKVSFPGSLLYSSADTTAISIEAMVYINQLKGYNRANARLVSLAQNDWSAYLELMENLYNGEAVNGGAQLRVAQTGLGALSAKMWHHLKISLDRAGYTVRVDGQVIAAVASTDLVNWNPNTPVTLELGNFDGWIDEVVVKRVKTGTSVNIPPVVSLASPAPDSNVSAPAAITITAGALDTDGSVSKVEFFSNNTKIGEALSAPFQMLWSDVGAGNYALTARATDNKGATAVSAPVQITVRSAPSPTPEFGAGEAAFAGIDAATQGNWKGVYGRDGYLVIGNEDSYPAYAHVTPHDQSAYIWRESTDDVRALQKASSTDRIAACWYAQISFTVEIAQGEKHRVAVYCLDWDRLGRSQKVEVSDADTGVLLDTRTLENFQEGKYLVWDLKGRVTIRFSEAAGPNALMMGLFFDPAPQTQNQSVAKLSALRSGPNGFELQITGEAGKQYIIQSSDDLKTWNQVGYTTLTASTGNFVDTAASSSRHRSYRAVLVQ